MKEGKVISLQEYKDRKAASNVVYIAEWKRKKAEKLRKKGSARG